MRRAYSTLSRHERNAHGLAAAKDFDFHRLKLVQEPQLAAQGRQSLGRDSGERTT